MGIENNIEFKNLKVQHEQLQKEYDDFCYIVSHDLKAPLRGITSIISWIKEDFEDQLDEGLIENFELLQERITKMSLMMDALTKISRVNRLEVDVVETKLDEFFDDLKEDLSLEFDELNLKVSGDSEVVKTYRSKLYKVLFELVSNAFIHNKETNDLCIKISFKIRDKFLFVEVVDNGSGVEEYELQKLQKLFYSPSKKNDERIGAGLFLVEKNVNYVKGKMVINNNNGIQVNLKWPIYK